MTVRNDEFEKMAFKEQCKLVFESPLTKRGDLVLRSQEPETLVNSFSADELFLIMKEMDGSDIPELIQYANQQQLQFMADFECWKADSLSEKGFMRWLANLEEAGVEKTKAWLVGTDFDVLVAGFKKYITVLKPYHEEAVDEVIGDRPYFTIDGFYYIMIDEDNMQTVKKAVEILFEESRHYYINLLEGIISELDAEVEEHALSSRQRRLAEKGFPEKEDAYRIYRALSEEEWQKSSSRVKKNEELKDTIAFPSYPILWSKERLFIDDVLSALAHTSRDLQKEIYQELVWMSNKIICCEGLENFGERQVRRALERTRYIVNIGLEARSNNNVTTGQEILCEHWLEFIFRWGFSQIVRVRDRAEQIIAAYWDYQFDELCDFLGEYMGLTVNALMRTYPQYMYYAEDEQGTKQRDFRSMHEVMNCEHSIKTLELLFKMLYSKPFHNWERFLEEKKEDEKDERMPLQVSMLVVTMFFNYLLTNRCVLKPLSESDLPDILKRLFVGRRSGEQVLTIKPDLKAAFLQHLMKHVDTVSAQESSFLKVIFDNAFAAAEEELSLIDPCAHIEQKFIHCVLFRTDRNTA